MASEEHQDVSPGKPTAGLSPSDSTPPAPAQVSTADESVVEMAPVVEAEVRINTEKG